MRMSLTQFRAIKEQNGWREYAALLIDEQHIPPRHTDQFGTYWIEAGHHIREQVADDRLLVRLLRHMLPAYDGEAIELYRGENLSRWEKRAVGLAWTTNIETARMFGRGLNAIISGGVLLKAHFESTAIISGPNRHSGYLGEDQFTIDPFVPTTISALEYFPSSA